MLVLLFLLHPGLYAAGQTNFVVNNNASIIGGGCHQLTNNTSAVKGSAWYPNQISLNNAFDLTFHVFQTGSGDGMAFVLQNTGTTAIGDGGNALGFGQSLPAGTGGINPSVAVELDLFDNSGAGVDDVAFDHLAIHVNQDMTNAVMGPTNALPGNANMNDGVCRELRIVWNPGTTTMQVYFDGVLKFNYVNDMTNNIFGGNPNVWFGMTGSSGGVTALQRFCFDIAVANNDTTMCRADTLPLNGNTSPTSWSWTNQTTGGTQGILNPTNPITSFVPAIATGAPSYTLYYDVSNGFGCTERDTVIVTVVSNPIAIAGPDVSICLGDSVGIGSGQVGGYTYSWSPAGGLSNPSIANPVAGPAATTIYTLTRTETTSGIACSHDTTVQVTVNPLPTANAGPNDTVCDGACTTIGGAPVGGYTYNWTPSGGAAAQPNVCPTTTTTYQQLVTDGNMCQDSATVTVTVAALPNAVAGADTTICDTFITLYANAVTNPGWETGTWTSNNGTVNIASPNLPNSNASAYPQPSTVEMYWTVTDTGGCTTEDTMIVTVTPPITAVAGPDTFSCGSTHQFSASDPNPATGSWSSSPAGVTYSSPTDFAATATFPGNGNYTMYWTVSAGSCVEIDSFTIAANPITANAGVDSTICDTFVNLWATAPTNGWQNGIWAGTSGGAIINSPLSTNSLVTNLNSGASTEIYWQVSDSLCSILDTVIITVAPALTVNAGIDTAICDTTYQLNATNPGPATGMWSTAVGGVSFVLNSDPATTVNGMPNGNHTIYWTVSAGSCSEVDSLIITVDRVRAMAGTDQTICGDSTTMAGAISGTGTTNWIFHSGSGTPASLSDPATSITGLSYGADTLVLSISNSNCSATDTVVVNAFEDILSDAGVDVSVCGDSTPLTGVDPASGTAVWTVISGAGNFADTSQGMTMVSGMNYGTNEYQWTVTNGPCQNIDSVIITADSIVPAYAGIDDSTCGSSLTLTGTTPSLPAVGTWTFLTGSGSPGDPNLATTQVNNLAVGNNVLLWTVVNGACSDADTVNLFSEGLVSAYAGADTIICASDFQLNAGAINPGDVGLWTLLSGGGTIQDSSMPSTMYMMMPEGSHALIWSVTNAQCSEEDTINITSEIPVLAAAGPDQNLFVNTTTLAGNNPGAWTGAWTTTSTASITSPSLETSGVTNLPFGTSAFVWTITQFYCPTTSDTVLITHSTNISIPNAFSPNGDPYNDLFFIGGLNAFNEKELTIFNRWGNLVYQDSNYNNDWRGENMDGQPLSDDTYYYVLDLKSEGVYRGFVVISR